MDRQTRIAIESIEAALSLLRVAKADPAGEAGALRLALDMVARAATAAQGARRGEGVS